MRNITITFADGSQHIYQGAPDNTTPEQAAARASQDFPGKKVAHLDGGEGEAQTASAAPAQRIDPTAGMGTGEKLLAGIGQSLNSSYLGLKQAGADVGAFAERHGLPTGNYFRDLAASTQADVDEAKRLDTPLLDTGAGKVGRFIGDVATGAVTGSGGGLLRAAAIGAGMGAIQPVASDESRSDNAIFGAAGGAGAHLIGNAIGAAVRGKELSPEIQALRREGIAPTPGQILGGKWGQAEEKAMSLPLVGDSIGGARKRAIGEMNDAAWNRVLKPLGEELPEGISGREAVGYVQNKLSQAYDEVLPKLKAAPDEEFTSTIERLKDELTSGTGTREAAKKFRNIIKANVTDRMKGEGTDGQTLKNIESDLGRIRTGLVGGTSSEREIGMKLKDAQNALRDLIERANPEEAPRLQAINSAYAQFKIPQRAAAAQGSEQGVFTPAQLSSAVKASDFSKSKGRFAKGTAAMQDLGDTAKSVLGSKVPDSGTGGRLLQVASGGFALAHPGVLLAPLAAAGVYSEKGVNLFMRMLADRPDAAKPVANALQRAAELGRGGIAQVAAQPERSMSYREYLEAYDAATTVEEKKRIGEEYAKSLRGE